MNPRKKSNGSRTVLIVLGVIALFGLCCCGGIGSLVFTGVRHGARDDREAKRFVRPALLAMGRDWKPESARPYLASTWSDNVSDERTRILFADYAKTLGPLKTLGAFTSSHFAYGTTEGRRAGTRITMAAPASFQKASGTIQVELVKFDGKWGIESLRVDSSAFLK